MRRSPKPLPLACALLLGVATATSAQPDPPPGGREAVVPQLGELTFTQLDRAEAMATDHPNELWRVRALRSLKLDQAGRAFEQFRLAARYADKFSQHSLSLMYWHGVGTGRDRALAYVWSDLAAERGYEDLLRVREKMWLELGEAERRRALEVGPSLYAEYGDDVAQARTDWAIRRALADATGSRVGATLDRIEFLDTGSRSGALPRARVYYAAHRWSTERYWQAEDRKWNGKVIVLPMEKVDEPAPEGADAGGE